MVVEGAEETMPKEKRGLFRSPKRKGRRAWKVLSKTSKTKSERKQSAGGVILNKKMEMDRRKHG